MIKCITSLLVFFVPFLSTTFLLAVMVPYNVYSSGTCVVVLCSIKISHDISFFCPCEKMANIMLFRLFPQIRRELKKVTKEYTSKRNCRVHQEHNISRTVLLKHTLLQTCCQNTFYCFLAIKAQKYMREATPDVFQLFIDLLTLLYLNRLLRVKGGTHCTPKNINEHRPNFP